MELIQDLNSAQNKAVTQIEGPLLIVAGAGTGKTTVISRKIAYLIQERHIPADAILALTFTDKAAGEMEERVESLLPFGYLELWISTFHAFGEKVLKTHALDIGLSNNFKLLSETEQWLLLRQNLERLNLDYYQPKGNPTKFLEALVHHFSRLKDEDISPEQYLEYAENLQLDKDLTPEQAQTEGQRVKELANAYHEYQRLLLEHNALDFGDLITYTIKLFKARPEILARYQKQFRYLLVDEFQDTNYAQYDLIKLLAAPQNNLTVVGDDDQSIYKFRGAAISNILKFKEDFKTAQEVVLTENYRSGQKILDLAHKFIKLNDPERLEARLHINKALNSKCVCTTEIKHLHFKDQDAEALGVIKKIKQLKTAKDSWNDFVILVRANSTAEQFMPYLDQAQLPYQFMASKGLFSKPLILDLLAYLRLLDNYHESRALYRVLNAPFSKLTPETIMLLLQHGQRKNLSLYQCLKISRSITNIEPGAHIFIDKLLAQIAVHSQLVKEKSVGQVLLAFLQDSGYLQLITKEDNQTSREQVLYLQQFYKYLQKFEAGATDKSVHNFMQELTLMEEAGDAGQLAPDFEAGPESVKIMTVHSAKGLEFKYVFMVNLVDKRFPATEKAEVLPIPDALVREVVPEGDAHLQEERRLFYVGMTRAKQGLFFTSAEDYGGARKKKLSRFLIEAGLAEEIKPEPTGKIKFVEALNNPVDTHCNAFLPLNNHLPEKFSFTQFKAFETCPWQYRFAHLLRIPVPGKASLSFGKTMHKTLHDFFTQLQEKNSKVQGDLFNKNDVETRLIASLPLDDLLSIYESNWIDDWYYSEKNKEEYYKKGKEILKEFYILHQEHWPSVKYLEKEFNLKIENNIIKGAIDRIDAGSGAGLELVDYKTGNVPKKKTDIEQLLLYTWAVEEVFKEPVTKLTYYYLEENKALSFAVDQKAVEKVKHWAKEKIQEIQTSDFKATPGFHCQYCDFKQICEYRK